MEQISKGAPDHLYRPFLDLVYQSTPSGDLYLRIWPARPDAADAGPVANQARPWAYFMAGGGFHAGQHTLPRDWLLRAFLSRGYHFVSVQYRFCPHVALGDSVEDCGIGVDWVRANLPNVLSDFHFPSGAKAPALDLENWIAIGDSSGGTLCSLLALDPKRKPKVDFEMYGITDFLPAQRMPLSISPWQPVSDFPVEQIIAESKSRDPSKACAWCPPPFNYTSEEATRLFGLEGTPWDGAVDDPQVRLQWDVLQYLRNSRTLYQSVLRVEDCKNPEEWRDRCKEMSVYHRADSTFPSTMILHAEGDWLVSHEANRDFARSLREKKVKVREWYIPEGSHVADAPFHPDHPHWREYVVPIMDHIDSQLK